MKLKKVGINTLRLFFTTILSKSVLFLFLIIVARYLGDVDYGKYSFALAFVFLFNILSDFGLPTLITREIAVNKNKANEYLINALFLRLLLSFISYGLLIAIAHFILRDPSANILIYFLGLTLFFDGISITYNSVFNAYEELKYSSWLLTFKGLLVGLVGLLAIYFKANLIAIIGVNLFASIITSIVTALIFTRRFFPLRNELNFEFIKNIFVKSLPFASVAVLAILFFKIDVVMLKIIKGNAEAGWYSASYRLIEVLMFIPYCLLTAAFPRMSRCFEEDVPKLKFIYEKVFLYLYMLGLPIAIGTFLLAHRFIPLIYGGDYLPSIGSLRVLIWALAIIFVNAPFGHILSSIRKEKIYALACGSGLLLNIILNLILIPNLGQIGASVATLISEGYHFILFSFIVSVLFYKINLLYVFWKPLIASALMGICIYMFKDSNLILLIFLSALFYFILLKLFGFITQKDTDFVIQIIKHPIFFKQKELDYD